MPGNRPSHNIVYCTRLVLYCAYCNEMFFFLIKSAPLTLFFIKSAFVLKGYDQRKNV